MQKRIRIASGLACMLFAAWVAVDWKGDVIPFEPLIGFVLSFPTWAWAELREVGTQTHANIHPNDVGLAERLRETFTVDTRQFLRNHDFGQPYRDQSLHAMEVAAYDWQGAEHEFENAELDNISAEIIRLSRLLLEKLAIYSGPADNWPQGYFSIPTQEERGNDWFSDRTHAHINEVDAIATELLENLDRFEKAFRKLSPESFAQPAQVNSGDGR